MVCVECFVVFLSFFSFVEWLVRFSVFLVGLGLGLGCRVRLGLG